MKSGKIAWSSREEGFPDPLSAGGILPIDDDGESFWAIEELDKRGKKFSDIGGRYTVDDGHIFATIRREFYEETYGMCDVLVSTIRTWAKTYGIKKVFGPNGKLVYICIPVPISVICDACELKVGELENQFMLHRDLVVKQNPGITYKVLRLQKIKYLDAKHYNIGYRLNVILLHLG